MGGHQSGELAARDGGEGASWHELVQEGAASKGVVFAVRADNSASDHLDPQARAEQRAKMSWGRSRMGGRFAAACRRGAKRTPNQDSFFFVELMGRDFALGVTDGYGPRGYRYSELISWHLPLLLLRSRHFPGNIPEALLSAFSSMAVTLKAQLPAPQHNEKPSGAVCAIVVRRGSSLYAANSGDSRAVLYSAGSSHLLIREHKPEPEKGRTPPLRTSELPDVKIYPLDSTAPYTLVVGSDGVWDALSVEDVRSLVWDPQQKRTMTTSVRDCVGLAVRRWTHGLDEPSAGVPDITCVVFAIDPSPDYFKDCRADSGPRYSQVALSPTSTPTTTASDDHSQTSRSSRTWSKSGGPRQDELPLWANTKGLPEKQLGSFIAQVSCKPDM